MTSGNFYQDLPSKPMQTGLFDHAHHYPVPDDWTIVIADITGSTKAVAEGRYKDVNVLSSCAIIAVLNRIERKKIAYIYGGDGATFLIPASFKFDVASALYGVQRMATDTYKLGLRVGMVDVGEIRRNGFDIRAAKIETKAGVTQTALSGNGVAYAEKLIKDTKLVETYAIEHLFSPEDLGKTPPDFQGFECRWKPLLSRNGVDLCLLVASRKESETQSIALYESVLQKIVGICGPEDHWKPAAPEQLSVSLNPAPLRHEANVRTYGLKWRERMKYWLHVTLMTWTGWICFRFGLKAGSFDGRTYREATANHTDFLKFENALKLVMDVSLDKKQALEEYLERLRREGVIYYGLYVTPAAMMTCLVFDYESDHFHFVDGADGGYTMAAKQMKQQIRESLFNDQHGLGRPGGNHAA